MNQPVKSSLRSTNQLRKPSSWVTQLPESGCVQRGAVVPWLRPNADRMTWRPNDPKLLRIPENQQQKQLKMDASWKTKDFHFKRSTFAVSVREGNLEPWTFFWATWTRRRVKNCWNWFENSRYFPLDSIGTKWKSRHYTGTRKHWNNVIATWTLSWMSQEVSKSLLNGL